MNDPVWLEETRARASAESIRLRQQRSRLRAELKLVPPTEGRYILADAINEMPDWLESADIWKVMEWAPRGQGCFPFTDRILRVAGVQSARKVRDLSPRQRGVIADKLRDVGTTRDVEAEAEAA